MPPDIPSTPLRTGMMHGDAGVRNGGHQSEDPKDGQESRERMQGLAIKSTENHDMSMGGLGDQSENDR